MTRKEMEKEKQQNGYTIITNCIDMIDSIICYGGFGHSAKEILEIEEGNSHNYLEDYEQVLGREKVLELIENQLKDIVEIKHNVHTDSEGCTYNSIVYVDEI